MKTCSSSRSTWEKPTARRRAASSGATGGPSSIVTGWNSARVARAAVPAVLLAVASGVLPGAPGWGAGDNGLPPAAAEAPFVRVLGTAQDGGFPHAACEHEACRKARDGEVPRRLVSSLAIVLPASREVFLIDATPDVREQLDALRDVRNLPSDRVDRAPVDGVFLTHAHLGHYTGLAFFGFEAVHTRGLPVWTTPRLADYLRANGPWSQLVDLGNIELRALAADQPVTLGSGVSVTPFLVPHRDEFSDTVGYRIDGPNATVVFVPDTDKWSTWSPSLLDRLDGVDVALLDGSFFSADELPGRSVEEIGHPMIGRTMDLLQERVATGELRVDFIHLNHSNPALLEASEARSEIEARGFAVTADGRRYGL